MNSANLDAKELHRLLLAGRSVFDCRSVDELRREVLFTLERILGSEKGTFFITDGSAFRINTYHVVADGIEDKFLNLYRRYYHSLDPFSRKLRFTKEDVLTNEEVISSKNLLQSEYYHDFLKPQAIHHQLTIHLRSHGDWLGVVSLFRPKDASCFSPQEKVKAGLLAPYLTGALEKTLVLDKMATRERIIDTISGELPYQGIVVLNECFSAVYQDERAAAIIRDVTKKSMNPQRPLERLPARVYGILKEFVASARTGDGANLEGCCQGKMMLDGGKQKVAMCYQIIQDQTGRPLLLLRLEPEEEARSLDRILTDHGLSAREIEVIHLLAQGCKNAVIAELLCISEYTVDNHLKSIYRKMGVNNRTSVVSRLMELAGLIRPFENSLRNERL